MAKKKKPPSKVTLENCMGFVRKGARAENNDKISTGYFELDYAINFGTLPGEEWLGSSHKVYDPNVPLGIPCGRIVEIFGPEGGGKSSLCYRIVGSAQRMGHTAAWIDTEQSFSEDLAKINAVDLDELLLSDLTNKDNPDILYFAEDVLDNIVKLMKAGVKVIVLDSVANLVPKEMMEAVAQQQFIARLARLLSQNLGKITQWAGATNSLVLFINQIREKPGVLFGNPETTPGGRALKHNASLRLKITKRSGADSYIKIEDDTTTVGEKLIGCNSYVNLVKNRFARPLVDVSGKGISIDVPIYYEPYFPDLEEVVFVAGRRYKVITAYKGKFRFKDLNGNKYEAKEDGKAGFVDYVKAENLLPVLVDLLMAKSEETGVPLPPEIILYERGDAQGVDTPKTKKKKKDEIVDISDVNEEAVNVDDLEIDEENYEGEDTRSGAGEDT
jgi:protein RecA